ncbi:helix-turn-helix transcriptional regulator [Synechococcus sp. YX-04-1]|uniref:helix-turn-helix transcriptional regulator n=1 Tax=Synechococcus sp. YX-04-1 TaxID=3062778 RepID=UPI0026E39FA7|nr:helix-turn-helix transcriptional regulator [Synechococcus sp. YX-04-1]MDO6351402.1 helix-turn-helix transcriptional regulator [Synechococcus sp. YX-04-1]
MKLLDASFESCGDLQKLFQPLSPDLVALQLSSGLLKGRAQAWGFDGFRLNLLTTNQTLFLSGARRPESCTLALPLDPSKSDGAYQAQGISMPWPGLMGFNRSLIDFDLKLPAGAQLATVVINKAAWLDRHGQTGGPLLMKRWKTTNQLEVRPPLHDQIQQHLMALMHGQADGERTEPSEQLMQTLICCFEDPTAETLPMAKREARHQAAIDLLQWCAKHPKTPLKIEEISSEIFQSRTSLFQGSKEHFQRTPLELQRSIRLDRVRQLLINPKQRHNQGLNGVSEIVEAMGFSSRSHFARRYQQHFDELPHETLQRSHRASPKL